jgi:hypothetical protein
MKALLMFPDRDFETTPREPAQFRELTQDLALDTLLSAMAGDDAFLLEVGRKALGSSLANDLDTILYRQAILDDCLNSAAVVRDLYALATEALDNRRKGGLFFFISRRPSSMLSGSVALLEMLLGMLRRLRIVIDLHRHQFQSKGLTRLCAMLQRELGDEYLALLDAHLSRLKFSRGVLVSAELGPHAESSHFVLRQPRTDGPNWLQRALGLGDPAYTFHIHERDEAGARALSEMEDRGLAGVAAAASQSAQHILGFFTMLRTELAFYVCALNLRDRLVAVGAQITLPRSAVAETRVLHFHELYDVCLALQVGASVVGNTVAADERLMVTITGANQGGKSTFLRSVGLAQLMMQCGLFVGAASFAGALCDGLFTHYTREEDATMKRGKLDEELDRMSDIVGAIGQHSMVLLNESFAATNEHEGSEIALQVVRALLESGVKVVFVTHLYEFAHALFDRQRPDILFLRAERLPDGARTFKLAPGEPMATSYGADLYDEIFGATGSNPISQSSA